MATANVFDSCQRKTFFDVPALWYCNCGDAEYIYDREPAYSPILCHCGHELTHYEYGRYIAKRAAHLMELDKMKPIGKKNDKGKYRADLLLDLPRALKAVAELLTHGADLRTTQLVRSRRW